MLTLLFRESSQDSAVGVQASVPKHVPWFKRNLVGMDAELHDSPDLQCLGIVKRRDHLDSLAEAEGLHGNPGDGDRVVFTYFANRR